MLFRRHRMKQMDEMIDRKYVGRMAAFLKARYRKSWMVITNISCKRENLA